MRHCIRRRFAWNNGKESSMTAARDLAALRRFYARYITAFADVTDARLIEAFAQIEREKFLSKGPWLESAGGVYLDTETNDPAVLYQNILIALAPERRINNGEPSLHAKCLGELAIKPCETVV